MKYFFVFYLLVCCVATALPQNGRIISKTNYSFPDSDVVEMKKYTPDFDSITALSTMQSIVYLSDGLKIAGYTVSPKNPGKYPCIIYCRGGNRDFGSLGAWDLLLMQRMAAWGYIMIGSQYRGCCGSEGKDEFGGADVDDVINLLPAVSQIPGADTGRIGIFGWSRGGMMTYEVMKKSNRFKAAVVGAGMANAYNAITMRKDSFEYYVYAELIPDYYKNKDYELKKRSAIYWADSLCKTTPLLLLQGSSDWRVSPDESLDLVNKLYKAKHPVKFILYPGADHGMYPYRKSSREEIKNWFDDYLKKGIPLPDMEKHGD